MMEMRHRNKRTAQIRETLRKHKDNISTAFGRYKRAAEQADRETEVWGVPAAFNPKGEKRDFETSFNLSLHSE